MVVGKSALKDGMTRHARTRGWVSCGDGGGMGFYGPESILAFFVVVPRSFSLSLARSPLHGPEGFQRYV